MTLYHDGSPKMRSSDLLDDFTQFCVDNPDLDFWRALEEWGGLDLFQKVGRGWESVQKMDKGRP